MRKSGEKMARVKKDDILKMPIEQVALLGEEDAFLTFTELVRNSLKSLHDQGIERERVEEAMRKFEEFVSNINKGVYAIPGPGSVEEMEIRGGGKNPRERGDDWNYSSEGTE
jgi:hypothetical protein